MAHYINGISFVDDQMSVQSRTATLRMQFTPGAPKPDAPVPHVDLSPSVPQLTTAFGPDVLSKPVFVSAVSVDAAHASAAVPLNVQVNGIHIGSHPSAAVVTSDGSLVHATVAPGADSARVVKPEATFSDAEKRLVAAHYRISEWTADPAAAKAGVYELRWATPETKATYGRTLIPLWNAAQPDVKSKLRLIGSDTLQGTREALLALAPLPSGAVLSDLKQLRVRVTRVEQPDKPLQDLSTSALTPFAKQQLQQPSGFVDLTLTITTL